MLLVFPFQILMSVAICVDTLASFHTNYHMLLIFAAPFFVLADDLFETVCVVLTAGAKHVC